MQSNLQFIFDLNLDLIVRWDISTISERKKANFGLHLKSAIYKVHSAAVFLPCKNNVVHTPTQQVVKLLVLTISL